MGNLPENQEYINPASVLSGLGKIQKRLGKKLGIDLPTVSDAQQRAQGAPSSMVAARPPRLGAPQIRLPQAGRPLVTPERRAGIPEGYQFEGQAPSADAQFYGMPSGIRQGGQYTRDPSSQEDIFVSARGDTGAQKGALRGGLPGGLFHVEHTIPLWLGGTDNPENKTIMNSKEHTKKTAIESVLYKLYNTGDISLGAARAFSLNWNQVKKDDMKGLEFVKLGDDVKTLDVPVDLARQKWNEWNDPDKKVKVKFSDWWEETKNSFHNLPKAFESVVGGITTAATAAIADAFIEGDKYDPIKEGKDYADKVMKGEAGFFSSPLGQFGNAVYGALTIGWAKPDINQFDSPFDQKLAAGATFGGGLAGTLASFGALKAGASAVLGLSTVSKLTGKIPGVAGIRGALGVSGKIVGKETLIQTSLLKSPTTIRVLGAMGLFGLHGQLSREGTLGNLLGEETATFETASKRLMFDLMSGATIGLAGQNLRSYGGLGIGIFTIGKMEGLTDGEALTNAVTIMALHGTGSRPVQKLLGGKKFLPTKDMDTFVLKQANAVAFHTQANWLARIDPQLRMNILGTKDLIPKNGHLSIGDIMKREDIIRDHLWESYYSKDAKNKIMPDGKLLETEKDLVKAFEQLTTSSNQLWFGDTARKMTKEERAANLISVAQRVKGRKVEGIEDPQYSAWWESNAETVMNNKPIDISGVKLNTPDFKTITMQVTGVSNKISYNRSRAIKKTNEDIVKRHGEKGLENVDRNENSLIVYKDTYVGNKLASDPTKGGDYKYPNQVLTVDALDKVNKTRREVATWPDESRFDGEYGINTQAVNRGWQPFNKEQHKDYLWKIMDAEGINAVEGSYSVRREYQQTGLGEKSGQRYVLIDITAEDIMRAKVLSKGADKIAEKNAPPEANLRGAKDLKMKQSMNDLTAQAEVKVQVEQAKKDAPKRAEILRQIDKNPEKVLTVEQTRILLEQGIPGEPAKTKPKSPKEPKPPTGQIPQKPKAPTKPTITETVAKITEKTKRESVKKAEKVSEDVKDVKKAVQAQLPIKTRAPQELKNITAMMDKVSKVEFKDARVAVEKRLKRNPGESIGDYEKRLNKAALLKVGIPLISKTTPMAIGARKPGSRRSTFDPEQLEREIARTQDVKDVKQLEEEAVYRDRVYSEIADRIGIDRKKFSDDEAWGKAVAKKHGVNPVEKESLGTVYEQLVTSIDVPNPTPKQILDGVKKSASTSEGKVKLFWTTIDSKLRAGNYKDPNKPVKGYWKIGLETSPGAKKALETQPKIMAELRDALHFNTVGEAIKIGKANGWPKSIIEYLEKNYKSDKIVNDVWPGSNIFKDLVKLVRDAESREDFYVSDTLKTTKRLSKRATEEAEFEKEAGVEETGLQQDLTAVTRGSVDVVYDPLSWALSTYKGKNIAKFSDEIVKARATSLAQLIKSYLTKYH